MSSNIKAADYPLSKNKRELLNTPTGVNIDSITFENIMNGTVKGEDCRISKESLLMQASIAKETGNRHLAENFKRASEMVAIESDRIIEIYNALRPYRSTEEELQAIADELEEKYNASTTAAFVRQAAEVLKQRGRLKGDR